MSDDPLNRRLGIYLRPFFRTHLPTHRNLSPNTIRAYAEAWSLLVRYGTTERGMAAATDWRVGQVDRAFVLAFLDYLEQGRGVCVRTRNHRLAAVQSFYRYLQGVEPGLEQHCRRILAIPVKRFRGSLVDFLEKDELQATFNAVSLDRPLGHRDLTLLMFAYNTGARVHEIAQARRERILEGGQAPTIRLLGKGRKEREIPLWDTTMRLIETYLRKHRPKPRSAVHDAYLFLGCRGECLTRYQVGRIITSYIELAAQSLPSMQKKRLTAHSMRHTTAVHLLQSGAELNTIKAWLGHASVQSLQVYLDLDLASKREVLGALEPPQLPQSLVPPPASESESFLNWLDSL